MALLLQRSGVVVTHIPYRGAAPAMTDLLAGVVQLKLDTYTTSNPRVQAGKLRMLGIASSHRSRLMPETPTIAEMGLEGYEGMLWNAIMAPADLATLIARELRQWRDLAKAANIKLQ